MRNKFNIKQQTLPIQNGDIWRAHFENLYKDIPINQINSDQCIIQENLQTLEETFTNQNPLDFPITWEELTTQTQSLQLRKAGGPDSIKNEMLKCSSPEMQRAVLKLSILYYSQDVFLTSGAEDSFPPFIRVETSQTLITTVASV